MVAQGHAADVERRSWLQRCQRDVYYSIICDKIDQCLTGVKAPVVVAQATFKNKHRLQILERFPLSSFGGYSIHTESGEAIERPFW